MENANIMPEKERIEMKTKFPISAVLVLILTLAACAPKAAAPTKKGTVATAIPPVAKATAIPTQSAKTSPTTVAKATPTKEAAAASTPSTTSKSTSPTLGPALINDISVHDQSVQSGSVLVSLVDSTKPGWVAIFTDENDQPGTLLGYTAVPQGTSEDIKVTIDAKKATDKMIAMLLADAGKMNTFEYPGADEPVKNANINTNVMAVFSKLKSSQ